MSITKGVALITGSAQGIGRGIALRLARDGFNIALNDLPSRRDELRSVASDIENIGRKTCLAFGDVSNEQDVKQMVQCVAKQLGSLDVMVANAGIALLKDLLSTEVEEWDRIMAINARGAFLCYKHAAIQMIAQGRGGRIIGACSITGRLGLPTVSAYSASKFAIRGLTQAAALELGRYKITVNSYAPGKVAIPPAAGSKAPNGVDETLDDDLTKWRKHHIARRPIKDECRTEDVASLVSYLASEEAHFITGQCVAVDGGVTLS